MSAAEIDLKRVGTTVQVSSETPQHLVLAAQRATEDLDRRLADHQAIEIPGSRRGGWEYRESCITVDPFQIAACVGDLVGDEAVAASNAFLEEVARAYRDRKAGPTSGFESRVR